MLNDAEQCALITHQLVVQKQGIIIMEKLSFGGQEMSGNVGKYGETQAQICPYSQQTLKV